MNPIRRIRFLQSKISGTLWFHWSLSHLLKLLQKTNGYFENSIFVSGLCINAYIYLYVCIFIWVWLGFAFEFGFMSVNYEVFVGLVWFGIWVWIFVEPDLGQVWFVWSLGFYFSSRAWIFLVHLVLELFFGIEICWVFLVSNLVKKFSGF